MANTIEVMKQVADFLDTLEKLSGMLRGAIASEVARCSEPVERICEIPKIRELKEAYAQGRYDESMAQGRSLRPDRSLGLAALATQCGAGTTTDGKSILFKLSQLNEFVERIAAYWVAYTTVPPADNCNIVTTEAGGERAAYIEQCRVAASNAFTEVNRTFYTKIADMLAADAQLEDRLADQKTITENWKARCERRVADITLLCERHQKAIDEMHKATSVASVQVDDNALLELAHAASEEALSFGLSHDVFLRYFKTVRNKMIAKNNG